MQTTPCRHHPSRAGHALVIILVFLVVGLTILGATMSWTATNANLIRRNNQYFAAQAAAEAATEKVVSEMAYDYQTAGAATVADKLATYRSRTPLASEHAAWNRVTFSDAQGTSNATYVAQQSAWEVVPLVSQYQGLSGYASTFRVLSNARISENGHGITGAVRQDFQLATIPVFQFAIFYNVDLEIHPGPVMNVNGRVHSNRDFYTSPQNNLTFWGNVTAAGNIKHAFSPLDPRPGPQNGTVTYKAEPDSGVNSLNLPLGMENTPENVRKIVEKPPTGESASSEIGRQRFYNKSDITVEVYDDRVEVRGRSGTTIAYSSVSSFIKTNTSFFNKREQKQVNCTEIDVAGLRTWANSSSNPLRGTLARSVNSVWVSDSRTQSSSTQPGVRLINGETLPDAGLTVATPQPLYIKGHYNAPLSDRGTANTVNTKPAAVIADAVTILSPSWSDAKSTDALSDRVASSSTVNAAILAGIVPSGANSYSGGVENFPRFLEDWDKKTLTYNGSMIVMFPSQIATGTWKRSNNETYYRPPNRNWAFDTMFLNPTRLPPGTPEVRTIIRSSWAQVAPSTTAS